MKEKWVEYVLVFTLMVTMVENKNRFFFLMRMFREHLEFAAEYGCLSDTAFRQETQPWATSRMIPSSHK